jgi:hypothetical protein
MSTEIYQGNPCKRGHSGLRYSCDGSCVECKSEKFAEQYASDPDFHEKHCSDSREWKVVNLEKHREHARRSGRKNLPTPTRPCPEICELPGCTNKATCLDHDHKTHKFRGWLCNRHNRAFGLFGDSVQGIEQALEYLRKSTQKTQN